MNFIRINRGTFTNADAFGKKSLAAGINCLSKMLVIVVYGIIGYNIYMYFQYFVVSMHVLNLGIFTFNGAIKYIVGSHQALIMTIIFVYIVFNIIFNYTLAMIVSPGTVSEYYTKINKSYDVEKANRTIAKTQLKQLMKYNNIGIQQINSEWDVRCGK